MIIIKSHQPGKMLNGHQRDFCPACPQTFLKVLTRLTTGDQSDQSKVKLLCDNLNNHHIASLYEAFDADEAHLARRLELYYTPRNGSWLNVTEIELSVLHQQCLNRRIGDPLTLAKELTGSLATATQFRTSWGCLALYH